MIFWGPFQFSGFCDSVILVITLRGLVKLVSCRIYCQRHTVIWKRLGKAGHGCGYLPTIIIHQKACASFWLLCYDLLEKVIISVVANASFGFHQYTSLRGDSSQKEGHLGRTEMLQTFCWNWFRCKAIWLFCSEENKPKQKKEKMKNENNPKSINQQQ